MSEEDIINRFVELLDTGGRDFPSDFHAQIMLIYTDEAGVERTIKGALTGRPCPACGK